MCSSMATVYMIFITNFSKIAFFISQDLFKASKGGGVYHAPTLLGAREVKLIFWALRWKEKKEYSHNLSWHSSSDNKRCIGK